MRGDEARSMFGAVTAADDAPILRGTEVAKFDLEWLELFVEIYKTGSVSQAAEKLGIAQGSASIALNKLRAHVGDSLFSRTSKGMAPTAYAKALQPEFQRVLEIMGRAKSGPVPFNPRSSNRLFRICMTDISEILLLPRLLNRLYQLAPQVQIETRKISPDSPSHLESGELDLAVGFMPRLEAGFFQQVLYGQSFVCLAARNHPRITGNTLTKSAYYKERHIIVPTSGTGHLIVRQAFAKEGIKRQIALRLPSFLGLARIVGETELLALVPRSMGEAFVGTENIKILNTPIKIPSYHVKQHWHERFHTDPGNVWLRRLIAEMFMATNAPPAR